MILKRVHEMVMQLTSTVSMDFQLLGLNRELFTKLLTDSRLLKWRASSRQSSPVQGEITASNSNTSRQIVIHIGILFFQPLRKAYVGTRKKKHHKLTHIAVNTS